eukprot:CAMPEP_0170174310 /NCGR_PEP_ID=MMETSP0040_2-20121228/7536_1 /TAXON_ID=641309 /ORGANISM="Lotharella oceanica, Strain CCMP622" /LENGTH=125 /DNA_ID=CAMNT_0010415891 /DNA_START=636 /DNA_END=1013 /DNA_ORIENTATION=-
MTVDAVVAVFRSDAVAEANGQNARRRSLEPSGSRVISENGGPFRIPGAGGSQRISRTILPAPALGNPGISFCAYPRISKWSGGRGIAGDAPPISGGSRPRQSRGATRDDHPGASPNRLHPSIWND